MTERAGAGERTPVAADADFEAVREAYLTDLRAAIDEVGALRRNVDGRVAVTADHGEAFGEFGEFAHRPAMLHPEVRYVPWVTVSATDRGTREVDRSGFEATDRDLDEHMAALGYR